MFMEKNFNNFQQTLQRRVMALPNITLLKNISCLKNKT